MTLPPHAVRGRSVAIDALRVVTIVAVAAGHLWGNQLTRGPNAGNLVAFSWQVPLFFFLSGYLWKDGRGLREDVAKRARTLLVPFAAWTLLLGLPISVVLRLRGIDLTQDIRSVLWGGGQLQGPFAPYWFLPVFFLTTVLARALEQAPRWTSWTVASLGLLGSYFVGEQLALLPQDAAFAFPCLLFILGGQELARFRSRIRRPAVAAVITLALCAIVVALRLVEPLDVKSGSFGTPIVSMLVAIATCGSLTLLTQALLDDRWHAGGLVVTELAASLIVVLLTHTFCFDALVLLSENVVKLRSPIIFLVGLCAAWTAGAVIRRTPFSEVLSGVPRVPHHLSIRILRRGFGPTR